MYICKIVKLAEKVQIGKHKQICTIWVQSDRAIGID